MTIRAIIFDIGGVLIRTDDRSLHRKWETLLGMQAGELAQAVFQSEVCARPARRNPRAVHTQPALALSHRAAEQRLGRHAHHADT